MEIKLVVFSALDEQLHCHEKRRRAGNGFSNPVSPLASFANDLL